MFCSNCAEIIILTLQCTIFFFKSKHTIFNSENTKKKYLKQLIFIPKAKKAWRLRIILNGCVWITTVSYCFTNKSIELYLCYRIHNNYHNILSYLNMI